MVHVTPRLSARLPQPFVPRARLSFSLKRLLKAPSKQQQLEEQVGTCLCRFCLSFSQAVSHGTGGSELFCLASRQAWQRLDHSLQGRSDPRVVQEILGSGPWDLEALHFRSISKTDGYIMIHLFRSKRYMSLYYIRTH